MERRLEEQEALVKKPRSSQTLLTGDNIGLVSSVSEQGKVNETQAQQGRLAPGPPPPQRAPMHGAVFPAVVECEFTERVYTIYAVFPTRMSTVSDKQTCLVR